MRPYYTNVRKELNKMPKLYFEDFGMRNVSLGEIDSILEKVDLWYIAETFVYKELKNNLEKEKLYFYHTVSKAEIDFVYEKSYKKIDIFEVKYRKKVWIPRIFKIFGETYKVNRKIIFTKDILKYENNIYYIPVCLMPFIDF